MNTHLLTIAEAAREMAVSRQTLTRLIDAKKITAVNVGTGLHRRSLRVPEAAIRAFCLMRETK